MHRLIGLAVLAGATAVWGAAPPVKWRALTAEEKKQVAAFEARVTRHQSAGEFEEAAKVAERIAKYRGERQGESHWEAAEARWEADRWRRRTTVPARDRAELLRAWNLDTQGMDLLSRGRVRESVKSLQQSVAIRGKALPEGHPDLAGGYANLALCLRELGKHAEALESLRKALAISEKALPQGHPDRGDACNNLGNCLRELGKHAEALELLEKALAIQEKALSQWHPGVATSANNLAVLLDEQGKLAKAVPLYKKALAIREKALSENHPDTAASYNNVAFCLLVMDKPAEALRVYRKALAIWQKAWGEQHPDTAEGYNNVGSCLDLLGKPSEALPLHKKALTISNALPEGDRNRPSRYHKLANCLWELGEHARAARLWQESLPAQEIARLRRAPSGFDRAQALRRGDSPHAWLARALAQLGQPENAFRHAEASLARGLLDDLAVSSPEEQARIRDLNGRLLALESTLASLSWRENSSPEQRDRLTRARRQHDRLSGELSELLSAVSERQLVPLGRIQKAIQAGDALVLWIDGKGTSGRWAWACVVRREGKPLWARLDGTGKGGEWTRDDFALPVRLYRALRAPDSSDADRQKLLAAFRKQRLDPLRPHLKGVKRLFVVPTGMMAWVPADLMADDLAVRYMPSGSLLARSVENHRAVDGSSLLVLGDPTFDKAPPPEPPSYGVMVKSVLPGGHAARAGLQPGDVLLSIGTTRLGDFDELKGALSALPAKATCWREGQTLATRIQGTPLGAEFDQRSARAAVRAWWKEQQALTVRGTGHKRLPGTRLEAEAIASLVKGSTLLLGSDASEQRLDELIDKGEMKKYRLLHFGTHGETLHRLPHHSALILAQDKLPDPVAQLNSGKHPYDGRLTVQRIRQRWGLDADLVVLSACETGLGQDAGGDGLLGFAQAFLSKGARSVILTRWKVDDTATALLMRRFYENLLGKRQELKKPLGRAAALDEAKKWLRSLTSREAEIAIESLPRGKFTYAPKGQSKTYEHPYYWAAFTLIGDPD
jgi:tetratricopeptide (TPR) repeat protein